MSLRANETEIKFRVSSFLPFRKILKEKGGKFCGKVFERNYFFDTQKKDLRKKGFLLRLRKGFKNTITFKEKVKNKKFLEAKEIEIEISNVEKMKEILQKLGFDIVMIMEKYREKWKLGKAEILFDTLPMGKFIEIEGRKKQIERIAKMLGLKFEERIIKTYRELWEEFCKEKGIKDENITFASVKKIEK
jgi:adenylate cyclase class 2